MPDLLTASTGPVAAEPAPGAGEVASALGAVGALSVDLPQPASKAAPKKTRNDVNLMFPSDKNYLAPPGRNHADSLLLAPFVVSVVKSAAVALVKSSTPCLVAETAMIFQPCA